MELLKRSWRSLSFRVTLAIWVLLVVGAMLRAHNFFFGWDSFGYQAYLPATFIEDDPFVQDLTWLEAARVKYEASGTLYQISDQPDGTHVIRYPIGLAVLWTPWFLGGHAVALLTGHPADGFSGPYQWAERCGVLFYFLLGLLALRRVLLYRFSEGLTALTLFLLVFATNLIDHPMMGLAMSHIMLFSLYAGILLFTIRWSTGHRWKDAWVLGLLMGLAMLVRHSEGLCVLLPLSWGLNWSFRDIVARIRTTWHHWLLMGTIMVAVMMVQLVHWKGATGHWIVDAYYNPGEGLDVLAPHTVDFLFSFRKGWYLYTPLMVLVTWAIFRLRRTWREAFAPVLVFFLLSLFVMSSWTCWWYADSFSSRAIVGCYAVLALPLAALLEWIRGLQGWRRGIMIAIVGGCLVLNLFQYGQYTARVLHPSRMTKAAYLAVFGRTERPAGFDDLLMVERSYTSDQGRPDTTRYAQLTLPPQLTQVPPSPMDTVVRDTLTGGSRHALRLDKDHVFVPAWRLPFRSITPLDHAWVRARWFVRVPRNGIKGSFVTTADHRGANYGYSAHDLERMDLVPDTWDTVTTYFMTPEMRDRDDHILCYFWLRDTVPILVDGPHITVYQPIALP
jgi:hypothetical protein